MAFISSKHKIKTEKSPVKPPNKQNPSPGSSKSIPRKNHQFNRRTFNIFLIINLLAALYVPLQDCDEVFNYWEPTHYLNHRFGLQTWEYAPEFSIRSWLYIVIHAIIGKLGSVLFFASSNRAIEFYFVRIVLAMACAASETRLVSAVSKTLNPRISIVLMAAMMFSPGMFHASVAYLPSSFSMYTGMLGMAAFMDWHGGLKTAAGIMWFGIGGIVGWPFATALIVPFLIEDLYLASMTTELSEVIFRYLDGIVRCVIVIALQVGIDAFFYHRLVFIPWRIVMYNVFSGSERGPAIFGTEPWDFYMRNLLLNFNVWFLLALLAGPLLGLDFLIRGRLTTHQTSSRSLVFITPFYMWLTIFSIQPHKEERFMYPIYPFLCLNAAIALHVVLSNVGTSDPKKILGRIPAIVKLAFVIVFVLSAVSVGILRTVNLVTGYSAPLQIYKPLQRPEFIKSEETVCLGKEWYRFPSSYFLPSNMRAKFVKSAFDGLLPGEFNEAKVGFGFFPGTWLEPPGMNDRNIEDLGKHIDIDHCSFLVDSYFPGVQESSLEPNYILDTKTWQELQCIDFLDASQTSLLGRTLWLPNLDIIPSQHLKKWGRYCLLKRNRNP